MDIVPARLRRRLTWSLAALLLAASLGPAAPAVAQSTTQGQGQDALGNDGDHGSGAVYRPQTPQELMQNGTGLQIDGVQPIVLSADGSEAGPGPGEIDLRGPVLHAEGDLVAIWLDDRAAVIRLPQSPPEPIGRWSLVEAIGPPSDSGVLAARRVLIWPAPDTGS